MDKKIALKSGYYFMVYDKKEIPFFDALVKEDIQVNFNNEILDIYEAPTWALAQQVDAFMGNSELGYCIDDYIINNNINI